MSKPIGTAVRRRRDHPVMMALTTTIPIAIVAMLAMTVLVPPFSHNGPDGHRLWGSELMGYYGSITEAIELQ